MTTITRNDATTLIDNYCADAPADEQAAIERIMAIPASDLTEMNSHDWIRITGDLGMAQDEIDAVIYG